MKVITVNDEQQLSEVASTMLLNEIRLNPAIVLGVATGGTPKDTYVKLVEKVSREHLDLSKLKTVNLDEYVGLSPDHKESYWQYIYEHFYEPLEIPTGQALTLNGLSTDLSAECLRYEQSIEAIGGIDLQILGLGRNGHIGFNEPGTSFESKTHVVGLTESTRKANARFFDQRMEEVPTQAITVGISTIMKSRSILILVSGGEKADAMGALLSGVVDPQWPVTFLNQHRNVTVIVTKDAVRSNKEETNA